MIALVVEEGLEVAQVLCLLFGFTINGDNPRFIYTASIVSEPKLSSPRSLVSVQFDSRQITVLTLLVMGRNSPCRGAGRSCFHSACLAPPNHQTL
jgi:hypothetical protein